MGFSLRMGVFLAWLTFNAQMGHVNPPRHTIAAQQSSDNHCLHCSRTTPLALHSTSKVPPNEHYQSSHHCQQRQRLENLPKEKCRFIHYVQKLPALCAVIPRYSAAISEGSLSEIAAISSPMSTLHWIECRYEVHLSPVKS